MVIPRIGDIWEFYPTIGKKHTTKKQIKSIYWMPSKVDGKICPWIEWGHTPGARYLGDIRVKYFLSKKAIRLVSRATLLHNRVIQALVNAGRNIKTEKAYV